MFGLCLGRRKNVVSEIDRVATSFTSLFRHPVVARTSHKPLLPSFVWWSGVSSLTGRLPSVASCLLPQIKFEHFAK